MKDGILSADHLHPFTEPDPGVYHVIHRGQGCTTD